MPFPLLPIAISLVSKYAPSLIGKLTGSDKAEEIAEQVVGFAQVATGQDNAEDAKRKMDANPELALQFQRDLHSYELALAEIEYKKQRLTYDDVAGGRDVVKTALLSDDPVVRQARPKMMTRLGITAMGYTIGTPLFIGLLSYLQVNIELIKLLTNMILWQGLTLWSAFMTSFTGYTVGRSCDKKAAAIMEQGIEPSALLNILSKVGHKIS